MALQISPLRLRSIIFGILILALSGCVQSNSVPTALPDANQPTKQNTSIPPAPTQPTREPSPSPTFTLLPIPDPQQTPTSESPLPADPICQPGEADEYLGIVLPLADEHTVDSYEARKLEALSDETLITTLREKAVSRLEALRAIQPPACLQNAHQKMMESFELFIPTWDLIIAKDYIRAKDTLKQCLEVLAEATAYIVIAQWDIEE